MFSFLLYTDKFNSQILKVSREKENLHFSEKAKIEKVHLEDGNGIVQMFQTAFKPSSTFEK